MTIGSLVVYMADPLLYGVGRIKQVMADGRLLVEFDEGDPGLFGAMELELADRFAPEAA